MGEILLFDTSALAKRYIRETGSSWVEVACDFTSGNILYIAEVTPVEIVSAIVRRRRGGTLTTQFARTALAQFERDLGHDYLILDVTSTEFQSARALAEKHGLRAYDAVQLAIAAHLNRRQLAAGLPIITLVSADAELLAAAQTEGLFVENPNNHP